MKVSRPRKLFLNLPVADLKRSVDFFTKLGFEFNKDFTDDNATCMVVGEDAFVMLLTDARFKDFIKKPLHDATQSTAGTYAVSATSREEVDALVKIALANGGTPAAEAMDLGFMYGGSFYDPDGHHWELAWMDPNQMPPQ
ncbi:Glyoxalase family protein [Myxococcus hansupus]|uniref:Glyoxalase family protein n=1 Tax=Pseudomyxococcus hansupus TaxID=1297742 RepID=A0A0H4WKM7_9BACT|nr:VOC family protein [Myxococcus hansupus]AKQ63921.1 Glyoxalase family protein [Myxococcus hansupus]